MNIAELYNAIYQAIQRNKPGSVLGFFQQSQTNTIEKQLDNLHQALELYKGIAASSVLPNSESIERYQGLSAEDIQLLEEKRIWFKKAQTNFRLAFEEYKASRESRAKIIQYKKDVKSQTLSKSSKTLTFNHSKAVQDFLNTSRSRVNNPPSTAPVLKKISLAQQLVEDYKTKIKQSVPELSENDILEMESFISTYIASLTEEKDSHNSPISLKDLLRIENFIKRYKHLLEIRKAREGYIINKLRGNIDEPTKQVIEIDDQEIEDAIDRQRLSLGISKPVDAPQNNEGKTKPGRKDFEMAYFEEYGIIPSEFSPISEIFSAQMLLLQNVINNLQQNKFNTEDHKVVEDYISQQEISETLSDLITETIEELESKELEQKFQKLGKPAELALTSSNENMQEKDDDVFQSFLNTINDPLISIHEFMREFSFDKSDLDRKLEPFLESEVLSERKGTHRFFIVPTPKGNIKVTEYEPYINQPIAPGIQALIIQKLDTVIQDLKELSTSQNLVTALEKIRSDALRDPSTRNAYLEKILGHPKEKVESTIQQIITQEEELRKAISAAQQEPINTSTRDVNNNNAPTTADVDYFVSLLQEITTLIQPEVNLSTRRNSMSRSEFDNMLSALQHKIEELQALKSVKIEEDVKTNKDGKIDSSINKLGILITHLNLIKNSCSKSLELLNTIILEIKDTNPEDKIKALKDYLNTLIAQPTILLEQSINSLKQKLEAQKNKSYHTQIAENDSGRKAITEMDKLNDELILKLEEELKTLEVELSAVRKENELVNFIRNILLEASKLELAVNNPEEAVYQTLITELRKAINTILDFFNSNIQENTVDKLPTLDESLPAFDDSIADILEISHKTPSVLNQLEYILVRLNQYHLKLQDYQEKLKAKVVEKEDNVAHESKTKPIVKSPLGSLKEIVSAQIITTKSALTSLEKDISEESSYIKNAAKYNLETRDCSSKILLNTMTYRSTQTKPYDPKIFREFMLAKDKKEIVQLTGKFALYFSQNNKPERPEPETFLRTLNICKRLDSYIQYLKAFTGTYYYTAAQEASKLEELYNILSMSLEDDLSKEEFDFPEFNRFIKDQIDIIRLTPAISQIIQSKKQISQLQGEFEDFQMNREEDNSTKLSHRFRLTLEALKPYANKLIIPTTDLVRLLQSLIKLKYDTLKSDHPNQSELLRFINDAIRILSNDPVAKDDPTIRFYKHFSAITNLLISAKYEEQEIPMRNKLIIKLEAILDASQTMSALQLQADLMSLLITTHNQTLGNSNHNNFRKTLYEIIDKLDPEYETSLNGLSKKLIRLHFTAEEFKRENESAALEVNINNNSRSSYIG